MNCSFSNTHQEPRTNVSAIVAVYNGAETIEEALASISAQTYKILEVIVADDGSTDGSADKCESVLAEYGIPGKVLRLEKRSGAGVARNRAVAECSGDVIAVLDADDQWMPDHIVNAVSAFEKHAGMVAYVSRVEVREDSNWSNVGRVFPENPGYEPHGIQLVYERLLQGLNFWNVTLCFRKSAFIDSAGFGETLTCYEDYWLFLNLSRKGSFYLSNHVGCVVRRRSRSLSSAEQKKGNRSMSKPMYADRIALLSLMKSDVMFSQRDVEIATEAAASFIATEFKTACRARDARKCAFIISAIFQQFSSKPLFVTKIVIRSLWETLQLGSHLLTKKYFIQ